RELVRCLGGRGDRATTGGVLAGDQDGRGRPIAARGRSAASRASRAIAASFVARTRGAVLTFVVRRSIQLSDVAVLRVEDVAQHRQGAGGRAASWPAGNGYRPFFSATWIPHRCVRFSGLSPL